MLLSFLLITVFALAHVQAFAPSRFVLDQRKITAMRVKKDMTEEEREIAMEKALKAMTNFSNKYISNTETKYCSDLSIPAVVIKGLAEHKVNLGAPLCPCRFYEDKEKEAKDGYWNCPCVPMRERHECHCMLFLTEDNDFVGEETVSFNVFFSTSRCLILFILLMGLHVFPFIKI